MPGLNCWEYKKCGREPGGENVAEMGVCPAAIDASSDGLNGGRNGGRICWAVTGTLCDGAVQGTFAQKHLTCMTCEFFGAVKRERADQFLLLQPVSAIQTDQTGDHARLEAALRKQNEQLTELLNSLPVVTYAAQAGEGMALTYVSDNIASFASYRPDDLVEDPSFWIKRIHPDDASRVMEEVARGAQTGKLEAEYRWRVADGSYRW